MARVITRVPTTGKNQGIWKKLVKSGKNQGIFSLFHNLKKITEMMLYMITMATFFDENHLNYLYMSNFAIF